MNMKSTPSSSAGHIELQRQRRLVALADKANARGFAWNSGKCDFGEGNSQEREKCPGKIYRSSSKSVSSTSCKIESTKKAQQFLPENQKAHESKQKYLQEGPIGRKKDN